MSNASLSFNLSFDPEKEECLYLLRMTWQKSYLTENSYILLVVSTVISLIAVLPTILLNSLVIFAVITRRRLQSNCNILLAGLASTDVFTGLVAQPVRIAVELRRILGVGPFCSIDKVFIASIALVTIASLSHLVLISVDRYIAVKHSLRYQSLVTKQRILIAELFAGAFIMLVTIPEIVLAVFNIETKIFVQVAHTIVTIICNVCFFVVIYINCYLFSETRRQQRRIQTEQVPQEEAKRIKKDNKATITVVIILAALIMTYLPAFFNSGVMLFRSSENLSGDAEELNAVNVVVSWFTLSVILLGSLVNPIIYCWRSKKLRRVFLEILHFGQS